MHIDFDDRPSRMGPSRREVEAEDAVAEAFSRAVLVPRRKAAAKNSSRRTLTQHDRRQRQAEVHAREEAAVAKAELEPKLEERLD